MSEYGLYWGDIHNHNELGYGIGSLARSYDIARSHLDFYAFTPHAQFADGRAPQGYDIVNAHWEDIQKAAAENNEPGTFTSFLAHEWHSSAWGHVHVVCFDDYQPLHFAKSLADLQAYYRTKKAILVPHHIAYVDGVDWELFDGALSPIVEIFSEHGCSERDFGPFPMLGHSGGPGPARFTAQHGLALGRRFGFVAGTDNHDGYPGGYGFGLTGVRAEANTREAIFDGILNRRTIAATGDRIDVDLNAGDFGMGSVVAGGSAQDLRFEVVGWDFIKLVELVRNNVPVFGQTPDYASAAVGGEQTYRLRLEWGWGPMKGFMIFDWEGALAVEDGEIQAVMPCFSSDPFDEHRRKRILEQDASRCRWQSCTSRGGMFASRNTFSAHSANDALCLEVRGSEATRIEIDLHCQTRQSLFATSVDWSTANNFSDQKRTFTIGELLDGSQGFRMEKVPASVKMHRAVPEAFYTMSREYRRPDNDDGFYYLRVTQENGQMAWSSPIWFEG